MDQGTHNTATFFTNLVSQLLGFFTSHRTVHRNYRNGVSVVQMYGPWGDAVLGALKAAPSTAVLLHCTAQHCTERRFKSSLVLLKLARRNYCHCAITFSHLTLKTVYNYDRNNPIMHFTCGPRRRVGGHCLKRYFLKRCARCLLLPERDLFDSSSGECR